MEISNQFMAYNGNLQYIYGVQWKALMNLWRTMESSNKFMAYNGIPGPLGPLRGQKPHNLSPIPWNPGKSRKKPHNLSPIRGPGKSWENLTIWTHSQDARKSWKKPHNITHLLVGDGGGWLVGCADKLCRGPLRGQTARSSAGTRPVVLQAGCLLIAASRTETEPSARFVIFGEKERTSRERSCRVCLHALPQ